MNTLENILKDFKEALSTRKLILRYISSSRRLMIYFGLFLLLVTIGTGIYFDAKWILIPSMGIEALLFIYVMRITDQIKQWKYGSSDKFQETRYNLLIGILKTHGVYHDNDIQRTKEKINLLISILSSKVVGGKKSLPLIGFITAITTTLLRLGIDHKFSSDVLVLILTLVIMLFSILMMFLPIINDIMNREKNKMEELRRMLIEIMLNRLI